MESFRISTAKWANKLSSSGSENRWNKRGEFVIYCGSFRSLSTLELVVHIGKIMPSEKFKVMVISLPDDDSLTETIKISDLPSAWRDKKTYPKLQKMGSKWYLSRRSLILKVPSAIIPKEYNFVINTTHPQFKQVKLVRPRIIFGMEDFLSPEHLNLICSPTNVKTKATPGRMALFNKSLLKQGAPFSSIPSGEAPDAFREYQKLKPFIRRRPPPLRLL